MKKILVPTDFSDNSKAAFSYALKLAAQIDASVTVVTVYHPTAYHMNEYMITTDEELVKWTEERLEKFVDSNFESTMEGVVVADLVEKKLVVGFAADELVRLSKSGDYHLIVMGSTGSSGLMEKVFGKVSSHLAQYSACPVLLIPNGVKYQPVKRIMYASDYESANASILLQLEILAANFGSEVHLVNVVDGKDTSGPKDNQEFKKFLLEKVFEKKAPTLDFQMHVVENESVARGLEEYAEDHAIDWMVLVKPKRKFWERLTHKSATNKLIMNPNIPIMVMH